MVPTDNSTNAPQRDLAKDALRRERALDRQRIARLIRLNEQISLDAAQKAENKQVTMHLDKVTKKNVHPDDDDVKALQDMGFLYTAEELTKHAEDFRQDSTAQSFPAFLLQQELKNYLDKSDTRKAQSGTSVQDGYAPRYALLQSFIARTSQPNPAPMTNDEIIQYEPLDDFLKEQDQRAVYRELFTAATFFTDPNNSLPSYTVTHTNGVKESISIPPKTWEKAQKMYPDWSGKEPLPDVNVKKTPNRSLIRVDNIGVRLDQLNELINQHSDNIQLNGHAYDGKPNPMNFTIRVNGGIYTIGSSYDAASRAFKVFPVKMNADGTVGDRDEYEGWLEDFTDPVAQALLKLAFFKNQLTAAPAVNQSELNVSVGEEDVTAVPTSVTQGPLSAEKASPIIPDDLSTPQVSTSSETKSETDAEQQKQNLMFAAKALKTSMGAVAQSLSKVPEPEIKSEDEPKLEEAYEVAIPRSPASKAAIIEDTTPETHPSQNELNDPTLQQENETLKNILRKAQSNDPKDLDHQEVFKIFRELGMDRVSFNRLVMNGLQRENPFAEEQGVRDKLAKEVIPDDKGYPSDDLINHIRRENAQFTLKSPTGSARTVTFTAILSELHKKYRLEPKAVEAVPVVQVEQAPVKRSVINDSSDKTPQQLLKEQLAKRRGYIEEDVDDDDNEINKTIMNQPMKTKQETRVFQNKQEPANRSGMAEKADSKPTEELLDQIRAGVNLKKTEPASESKTNKTSALEESLKNLIDEKNKTSDPGPHNKNGF